VPIFALLKEKCGYFILTVISIFYPFVKNYPEREKQRKRGVCNSLPTFMCNSLPPVVKDYIGRKAGRPGRVRKGGPSVFDGLEEERQDKAILNAQF